VRPRTTGPKVFITLAIIGILIGVGGLVVGVPKLLAVDTSIINEDDEPGSDVFAVIEASTAGTAELKANTTYGVWLLFSDECMKALAELPDAAGPSTSAPQARAVAFATPQPDRTPPPVLPTPSRGPLPGTDPTTRSPSNEPQPSQGDETSPPRQDQETPPATPRDDSDNGSIVLGNALTVVGPDGTDVVVHFDPDNAYSLRSPARAQYAWYFTTGKAGTYQITGISIYSSRYLVTPPIDTTKQDGVVALVLVIGGAVLGALGTIQLIWGLVWRHRRVKKARRLSYG